jgi:two-component system chemotaxis response regulator CheY
MATILIVDDCSAVRTVIERILGISGFAMDACHFASDGEDALEVMGRHRVDLVISDINMPRLDGEGLLQKMSEDIELSKIPVVIVSSDSTQSRMERLIAMGAKAYVVKPFRAQAFREQVEKVLGEVK